MFSILLASHGTPGAKAAENHTYNICTEYKCVSDISLTHLYVIPELWGNMLADDWLNNACTHHRFGKYLQTELKKEAEENTERVRLKFERLRVKNRHVIKYGEPKKCLIDTCLETNFDLIILGSQRPKKISGLKSSMLPKKTSRRLPAKLLQIPHPLH